MFYGNLFGLAGDGAVLASSLMDYFVQSNFAGQIIVVVLMVLSVVAWGVMFCKKADLSAMEAMNERVYKAVARGGSLGEIASNKSFRGPFAALVRDAVAAWQTTPSSAGSPARISRVENALQRAVARQLIKYEANMVRLGTIISGAPFLGLLGTAWGVMDCFGAMSNQASVTLQNLAPGVAGSLLTTVAGLVVAIPSVFGYNFLSTKAREMTTKLENFASLVADTVEAEAAEPVPQSAVARNQDAGMPETVSAVSAAPAPSRAESKVLDFSLEEDEDGGKPFGDFDD